MAAPQKPPRWFGLRSSRRPSISGSCSSSSDSASTVSYVDAPLTPATPPTPPETVGLPPPRRAKSTARVPVLPVYHQRQVSVPAVPSLPAPYRSSITSRPRSHSAPRTMLIHPTPVAPMPLPPFLLQQHVPTPAPRPRSPLPPPVWAHLRIEEQSREVENALKSIGDDATKRAVIAGEPAINDLLVTCKDRQSIAWRALRESKVVFERTEKAEAAQRRESIAKGAPDATSPIRRFRVSRAEADALNRLVMGARASLRMLEEALAMAEMRKSRDANVETVLERCISWHPSAAISKRASSASSLDLTLNLTLAKLAPDPVPIDEDEVEEDVPILINSPFGENREETAVV